MPTDADSHRESRVAFVLWGVFVFCFELIISLVERSAGFLRFLHTRLKVMRLEPAKPAGKLSQDPGGKLDRHNSHRMTLQ